MALISSHGVHVLTLSVGLIVSCCAQNACLERLILHDRRGGSLVTFIQYFSVVIIEGVTNGANFWKHRQIPLWIFFLVSIVITFINKANNTALTWGISVALSTLYRSCTVAMSVLVGMAFFGNTYSKWQIFGALSITVGIIMCTFGDYHFQLHQSNVDVEARKRNKGSCGHLDSNAGAISCFATSLLCRISTIDSWEHDEWKDEGKLEWMAGLLLITSGLFAGVMLGHFQDRIYRTYANKVTGEKPYQEFFFFNHAFSLPMILGIDYNRFRQQLRTWIWDSPVQLAWYIPYLNIQLQLSELSILMLGCVIFQYGCAKSAYALSASTSTVALNIVLTTRKACTILFSVFWFGTRFTFWQWLGSAMVLIGALVYSLASQNTKEKEIIKNDTYKTE